MSDIQVREYVANMYDSTEWRVRVSRMPQPQVFAIYMRAKKKEEREIEEKKAQLTWTDVGY